MYIRATGGRTENTSDRPFVFSSLIPSADNFENWL